MVDEIQWREGGAEARRGDPDLEAEVEVEEKRGVEHFREQVEVIYLLFLIFWWLPPCVFDFGEDQCPRGSAAEFERRIRVSIYKLYGCVQNKSKSIGSLHVMRVDWWDVLNWNRWRFYCWSCWFRGPDLIFSEIRSYEWIEEVIPVRIGEKKSLFERLMQKLHEVEVSTWFKRLQGTVVAVSVLINCFRNRTLGLRRGDQFSKNRRRKLVVWVMYAKDRWGRS